MGAHSDADAYRLIVQEAPTAIALLDLEGLVIEVNPATEQLLGCSRDEILGEPCEPLTHPDDHLVERPLLTALLEGEREEYELEKRYLRKDGSHVWSRLRLRLVRDEAGAPSYLLALIEDITDRRRIEEEQRALTERLRQAQKLEAVGQLAGGVAHDFNNLLTVMIGHAELAMAAANDEVKTELDGILVAGERAAELVRQLLTFSRQQEIDARPLDLNDVVTSARSVFERVIESNIEIAAVLCEGPLPVFADRAQLEQLVVNLALNARDAMPEGGRLTIRTHAAEAAQAVLRVEDTGMGMDDETRSRAFEPFYTTKEFGRGTGLGLTTVYGIVESAGGTIRVESAPGRGTTVEVALPLATSAKPY